jgi:hypothetical protein
MSEATRSAHDGPLKLLDTRKYQSTIILKKNGFHDSEPLCEYSCLIALGQNASVKFSKDIY